LKELANGLMCKFLSQLVVWELEGIKFEKIAAS
jgi:hypothetical protein